MDAAHFDERSVTAGRHIVLMDLDGALLDSSVQHALAWQEALSSCGYRPSQKEVLLFIAQNGPEIMPPLLSRDNLRTYGEAVRAMYRAIYVRSYLPTVRPLPEAMELIHDLKMQGLRVAIASTGRALVTIAALERLGLRELVDATVAADDLSSRRPDRDRVALDKLNALPEEAVVIGATLYSLRVARRLDLPFIAVGSPIPPYDNWIEAGAVMSFADHPGLRAHLRHLLPTSAPDAWLARTKDQEQRLPYPDQRVAAQPAGGERNDKRQPILR
jgi:beta-phosphoglucomutase-like phosphatase (HAD superfamily)